MVLVERYGIPSTRIVSVVDAFQYPFRNVRDGDRILIMTDDAMDPMVWQAAMTVIKIMGGDPVLCLYPRRPTTMTTHPPAAMEAARGTDVIVALATTALNSGTPGLKHIREIGGGATGKTPVWLMEEITAEILTEGGGRARTEDIEEIVDLGRRIGEVYDKATRIHITSKGGTDVTPIYQACRPATMRNAGDKFPSAAIPRPAGWGTEPGPLARFMSNPYPILPTAWWSGT